jgi:Family of unknown function (DUF6165)
MSARPEISPPDRDGMAAITVPVAPGEVLDKISILEIKAERLGDPGARRNVARELDLLNAAFDRKIGAVVGLDELRVALKRINEALWTIEDEIRLCERRGEFGPRFVALARAVYRTNDQRAGLKREINTLLGSALIEEKSYTAY